LKWGGVEKVAVAGKARGLQEVAGSMAEEEKLEEQTEECTVEEYGAAEHSTDTEDRTIGKRTVEQRAVLECWAAGLGRQEARVPGQGPCGAQMCGSTYLHSSALCLLVFVEVGVHHTVVCFLGSVICGSPF